MFFGVICFLFICFYLIEIFLTIQYGIVLSAAGGIKVAHPDVSSSEYFPKKLNFLADKNLDYFYSITEIFSSGAEVVVVVAVLVLVCFFSMQHYGTDRVSWLFAPIVLLWFLLIGGIGIYNIWKYDKGVLRAFSPVYIYRYLKHGGKDRFTSLGGLMLCITGWIHSFLKEKKKRNKKRV